MKELTRYAGKRVKIISVRGNEYIGYTIGCTSALDNEGEESIDIRDEKTGKLYELYESEIVDIIVL